MIHALKTKTEYFEAVRNGDKTFEVRKNDRQFAVGDFLALNEVNEDGLYSGKALLVEVTYILNNPEYCKEDYVVMSIGKCRVETENDHRMGRLPRWLLEVDDVRKSD